MRTTVNAGIAIVLVGIAMNLVFELNREEPVMNFRYFIVWTRGSSKFEVITSDLPVAVLVQSKNIVTASRPFEFLADAEKEARLANLVLVLRDVKGGSR